MPTLTVTKTYADDTILTEAMLDASFESISTFVNVTGLGSDNLQDGSVGTAELQTSAVTEAKIAASAATTAKIADNAVTLQKLATALQAFLVPTGTIQAFGSATAPTGWLVCDGTAVSRTTYADLFTAIGENFGQGDNSTTFNLPDFRGRFLRGMDGGAARDPDAAGRTAMNTGGNTGSNVGSVQDDQYASHVHPPASPATHSGLVALNNMNATGSFFGSVAAVATNTGASGGNETRPKNAYVQFIIKT